MSNVIGPIRPFAAAFLHSRSAQVLTHGSLVVLTVTYFGLLLYLPLWIAFAPCAYLLHNIGILLHEYFHGSGFRRYRDNHRVVTLWDGIIMTFGTVEVMRGMHLSHHKWLNKPAPGHSPLLKASAGPRRFTVLAGFDAVRYVSQVADGLRGRMPFIKSGRIVAGFALSLLSVVTWTVMGHGDIVWRSLLVTLFTIAVPVSLRGAIEHASHPGDPGFANEYRTLLPHFNVNRHIHHHMDSTVPWYRLQWRTSRPLAPVNYFTYWFRLHVTRTLVPMQPMAPTKHAPEPETPRRHHTRGTMASTLYGIWVITTLGVLTPPLLKASTDRLRAAGRGPDATPWLINAGNVDQLAKVWTYRTGDFSANEDGRAGTAFQATPVLHDGTLYFPTPYSRVIALDAATGRERWTFDPVIDRSDRDHKMVTSRGVRVWTDPTASSESPCRVRVLAVSYDARLFALDGATGKRCTGFGSGGVVNLRMGVDRIEGRERSYWVAPPPVVFQDMVAVGSTIFDNLDADAPSGVVRAFDIRTGKQRWAWEPLAGVGARDSAGEWVSAGAANTWATMLADEARDLLFVPTSSASPDHYGGLRPGANAYANSVVALRASTGQVVWHFQTVHHDLWDYDLAAPPALVSVRRWGALVPAVVITTKLGYVFVLPRETGQPLFPIEERPVPKSDVPGEEAWPTQPVPVLPRPLSPQSLSPDDAWGLTPLDRRACREQIQKLRHDGVFAPPSLRGTVAMPGFLGGLQWGGAAWDQSEQLLVVNALHLAMVATLIPREGVEAAREASRVQGRSMVGGQLRTPYGVRREPLLSPLGLPCNAPPWGTLAAVDLVSGDVRWEVPLGTMTDVARIPTPSSWGSINLGGPVVTGGLVFIGATMDRRIRAFAIESGELVWEDELPASGQATPLLYENPNDGRQMLVIAAGGHSQLLSTLGDYVVAYALPASSAKGTR